MNSNQKSFSVAALFKRSKPYIRLMRLHRAIGIWLCLLPALWAQSLASPIFHVKHLFLFTLGAFLVRGAGCTINDLIDRDFDKKVMRTKERPIACGLISPSQALLFLGVQLFLAMLILLNFNRLTIFLGFLIIIPILLYPFFKRFTYWPQVFLGIVFNWGCLMGWASVHNSLSLPPLILYLSCIFWTIGYDTVYAFQDRLDDQKIGIKSSALKVGIKNGKIFVGSCYFLFFLGIAYTLFLLHKLSFIPFIIPLLIIALTKIQSLKFNSPQECDSFFQDNGKLGALIWGSFLLLNFVK